MRRRDIPQDEWQYHDRASVEVRATLLRLSLEFVRAARRLPEVQRVAVLGSLVTAKPRPKDADLLVTVGAGFDLDALATLGRRLQGRAQAINSTADIFLSDTAGAYIGRLCHYRDCHPRALCRARHCGGVRT